jgi:hypothetical protein
MKTVAGADGHGPQHRRAPEHASRVRVACADVKRRVAAGEFHAAEVVLVHPWMVESMPLAELLICQPSWGHARCRTFLESVGLDESMTLGGLTERQRVAVAAVLSTKPGRRSSSAPDRPRPS